MPLKNRKNSALLLYADRGEAVRLKNDLRAAGIKVAVFSSPSLMLSAADSGNADIALISRNIRGISARDLAVVLRRNAKTAKMVIIFFSKDRGSLSADFDSGIDEFFDLASDSTEFIKTRVLNLLTRRAASQEHDPPLIFEEIELDLASRSARVNGREAGLTNLEFEILAYFMNNRNRIVTRKGIIEAVWKDPFAATLRSVDKRIEMIRKKIGPAARHIQTVFSVGYMFK